jgi:Asp-tRNA(Asn)/Glu-tRNA(Gln) amidotransferase B subunit
MFHLDGFKVDLGALEMAAEGVDNTLDQLKDKKVNHIGGNQDDYGNDDLADTVADFCDRWELGVENLAKDGQEIAASPIPPADIAALVELIETGVISSKIAKQVFEHMWAGEGAPKAIVEKHGLVQVTDTGAIEAVVEKLIAANPGQAEAVKAKPQAIGWFVGQVMKEMAGKANPAAVNAILKAKLGVE